MKSSALRVTSPVLVVSQLPPPVHGSTVMTRMLIDVLGELGHPVVLVDRRFSRDTSEVGRPGVRKGLAAVGLIARLWMAIKKEKPPRAVFFCTNRTFSFLVDWILSEVLRRSGTPYINYIHTSGYTQLAARGRVWARLVARLLGGAEHTVCLSASMFEDVEPWVAKRLHTVIPNATRPAPPATATSSPSQGDGPVLFMSNLMEEKGIREFVELGLVLCQNDASVQFLIAGGTSDQHLLDELTERVSASGHADRIQFNGPADQIQKWDLLRSCRLLVFPSRYRFEAQPLTLIEAMSQGTPILATRVGAIPDLLNSGRAGRLVPVDDFEALLEATAELIRRPEALADLGTSGRLQFDARHSPRAFATAWAALLSSDTVETQNSEEL
nr:glycosyltransferase family 4 protein [Frigoribacterium sp. CFBP 13707]